MTKLHGTKTEQNLINAFAGESQARNRYSYFAKQAKEEGYEQISAIFLDTADMILKRDEPLPVIRYKRIRLFLYALLF